MGIKKIISSNVRIKKSDLVIIGILVLAISLRIVWTVYTNHTFEDAFITFQYARRISQGSGFVYNEGEKICGTTTPLFSLLLSFWIWVFSEGSVIIGAKIFTMVASISSLIFLLLSLRLLNFSTVQQGFALSLLVIWPKLWLTDTGGMETSLVIFFITSSWYMFIKRKPVWTGILLGLMLWTRIDTIIWVVLISVFELFRHRRDIIKILSATIITFTPWLIFAFLYFGSPIPYTIVAKQFAYSKYNTLPYHKHLFTLFKRLGPVNSLIYPGNFSGFVAVLISFVIILAIVESYIIRKDRKILLLSIFSFSEIILLTFTKATFTSRYVIPSLYIFLLLAGLCIGQIWENVKSKLFLKYLFVFVSMGLFAYILSFGVREAVIIKNVQINNHQKSLQRIGEWLNENTEQDATVQLEPLGYAGYYANRRMLDVVGLITPTVVDLKKSGLLNPHHYIPILEPDYLVVHCDDILRWLDDDQSNNLNYLTGFNKLVTFNPLDFDPTITDAQLTIDYIIRRNSCYEIWGSQ